MTGCRVGADITLLREREVDYELDKPRKIAEVLVRKVPDNQQVSTRMSYNRSRADSSEVKSVYHKTRLVLTCTLCV